MNELLSKKCEILDVWARVCSQLEPKNWISSVLSAHSKKRDRRAALFWGKAAGATARVYLRRQIIAEFSSLVISPEEVPRGHSGHWVQGSHPIPDSKSFEAGSKLLEFFDYLRRADITHLDIFLSGGASSLAWIRSPELSEIELRKKLEKFYRLGLPISETNRQRAKWCALKGGGAGQWLRLLSARTRARAFVISDVLPYSPEVVGSGPFWGQGIVHQVVADNKKMVDLLSKEFKFKKIKVLGAQSGLGGDLETWRKVIRRRAQLALINNLKGILIFGGEPTVKLKSSPTSRGGRMTHLAAALALDFQVFIKEGRVEILCAASDGLDGKSNSSGALIRKQNINKLRRSGLAQSLRAQQTAKVLGRAGALLPTRAASTNVQDVVCVRILAKKASHPG